MLSSSLSVVPVSRTHLLPKVHKKGIIYGTFLFARKVFTYSSDAFLPCLAPLFFLSVYFVFGHELHNARHLGLFCVYVEIR